MSKSKLRIVLKNRRLAIEPAERQEAERRICEHIRNSLFWQQARTIGFYCACNGEPSLAGLVGSAQHDLKCYFIPSIANGIMQFLPWAWSNSETSAPEIPKNCTDLMSTSAPYPVSLLDLILVPLVGFNRNGQRLGQGKGFYDKTLSFIPKLEKSTKRPFLMGVGHSCQECGFLPEDPWDIRLDAIVTPQEVYKCPQN